LKKLLATLCGVLAACALFAIMALTLVDVGGRKFAEASIPGSLELTELLMVIVIFAGLPLVSLQSEHVVFDSLDRWLPRGLRRVQQTLVDLACAGALLGVAWLMWSKAAQMAEYGDVTAQLKLALPPFVRVMAALCGVTGLVHLMLAFQPAASSGGGAEAGGAS
jgi:TRAP-type transport system small permease protein